MQNASPYRIFTFQSPISCLGVQRFTGKSQPETKLDNNNEAQCLFCSYHGSDLPHHYSSEHNVFTGSSKLLKPALRSILNILTTNQPHNVLGNNNDMKMSDGTLIVMPEEPQEPLEVIEQLKDEMPLDGNDINNCSSMGSRKRKMCQPVSTNGTGGAHLDESDCSETNSDNYNNQFVCHMDNDDYYDHPHEYEMMSASFIDSHLNNIMITDEESSEHSSDISRPLNGDLSSLGSGCVIGQRSTQFGSRMMRKRGRPPKIASQVLSKGTFMLICWITEFSNAYFNRI